MGTEFEVMINRKVVLLGEYMESKINEVRQDTTSLLEEVKSTVAAVHESQERMWWAIHSMSKEVQKLV